MKSKNVFRSPVQTVRRVDQSPMNGQRWCLTLTCNHEVWVTSSSCPKRSKMACPKCPMVAGEK
jgi:hypothetical protein